MTLTYTRLFDIPRHQHAQFPQDDCLAYKYDGIWRKYSTQEVVEMGNKVSYALMNSGFKKSDTVAIISHNRPEWNFIDLGCLQIGAIVVPLYPTGSEHDFRFFFNHAEIKLCFVEDKELYEKMQKLRGELPSLQAIYTFNQTPNVKNWKDFLGEAEQYDSESLERAMAAVHQEDLATIIYTSGTTGEPKGVMLSHRNIVSNVQTTHKAAPVDHNSRALSFLPMCHIFERMVVYTYLSLGVSVYYAENLETIGENLKEVKPHYFTTVPRLLEKVYEKVMEKGLQLTGFRRRLFFWSLGLAERFDLHKDLGIGYNLQLWLARKLVFKKWKDALGGEVIGIVSGSSALNPKLANIFTAADIPVMEGYGLTESAPVISANHLEVSLRKLGTVGIPIPGLEVKIADDGEILARGPNIMIGYYKRPDLTAEALDEDGWLHTGDIGEFDGQFLKITDRKKELIKTSGGKYVAPLAVETKFKESPYIEQIMETGNNRKYVSALIIPAFDRLKDWAGQYNITFQSNEDLIKMKEVVNLFQLEMGKYNQEFGQVEQIKKFTLLPKEWIPETGELTPTMKVKRKVVEKKYAREIEKMYE